MSSESLCKALQGCKLNAESKGSENELMEVLQNDTIPYLTEKVSTIGGKVQHDRLVSLHSCITRYHCCQVPLI